MVTKLDRAVLVYLHALAAPCPAKHDDTAWAAKIDELDRKRFAVLDTLIRKPRYSGRRGRDMWRSKQNPHRPPLA
jgi:hypothetical protein